MFIFQQYDIGMFLFVFWLRNRISIKYVRNWGNGEGSSKMCIITYSGRGVEKLVVRYICNVVAYFCALIRLNTLVHHLQQGNIAVFFHHNYDYYFLCDNQNLVLFFYIRIFVKKLAFDFLKRISYTNVCLKFLCDEKLIMPLNFQFLVKI